MRGLSKLGIIIGAAAMMHSMNGEYSVGGEKKQPTPDWKRKKCKSCENIEYCHGFYKKPKKQACESYSKIKK